MEAGHHVGEFVLWLTSGIAPAGILPKLRHCMNFNQQLADYVGQVEAGIDRFLPPADERPTRLHTAMRYAMQGGGKRLRPVMALATAELFGAPADDALPAAMALECIHTYSLVHDDLPCMDDDDLRRGRATTHKAFDEATALLAGDALLTHAFVLLTVNYANRPAMAHALCRELAAAAGSRRLIGGQMEDLLAEKRTDVTAGDLDLIHLNKTAAMIEASLVMGGIVGGAETSTLDALRRIGRHLGLTFQIVDDILDATADTATLGKTAGKDAEADKTTYVKLHGIDTARRLADEQTSKAVRALASLPGDTAFLTALARKLTERKS
jgi:geranylgeranyl diphosphate synthase type II